MSDQTPIDDELVSRLRIIEAQPLAARAGAYASLHDELAKGLESGTPSSDAKNR